MILKRDSKRIKELEEINEEHRKINDKLRDELNFKLEYKEQVINYIEKLLEIRTQERTELEQRIDEAIKLLNYVNDIKTKYTNYNTKEKDYIEYMILMSIS